MPEAPHTVQPQPARKTLSLYLHWPFCRKKCPYCDFNSHVRETVNIPRWEAALKQELRWMSAQMPDYTLGSIFFGGGTPSLMPAELVASLLGEVRHIWGNAPVETTLEANPTSVEAHAFAALKEAGINRVSLGVQALRQEDLEFLGREHTVAEALGAVELAASIFERYSFDLIYGRPKQTLSAWEDELREALPFMRDHLSLYQLTIEPDTPFSRFYKAGNFKLPEPELAAQMYQLTAEVLAERGLEAYEISNYAKPGAECQHNQHYWQGDAYLGVGPGAHGRLYTAGGWQATAALKSPERWLSTVEKQAHGLETIEMIPNAERCVEWLLTGLRTREGICISALETTAQLPLTRLVNKHALTQLQSLGLLEQTPTHLRATHQGWLVLDSLLAKLLS